MESSLWQDVGKILFRENAMHVRSLVRSMERCAERTRVICWFFWRMLLPLRRQRTWAQQVQSQKSAWMASLALTAWRLSVRHSTKPNNNDGLAGRACLLNSRVSRGIPLVLVCWRGSLAERHVWQEEQVFRGEGEGDRSSVTKRNFERPTLQLFAWGVNGLEGASRFFFWPFSLTGCDAVSHPDWDVGRQCFT